MMFFHVFPGLNMHIFTQMCQKYVLKRIFQDFGGFVKGFLNGKTSIESRCLFGNHQAESPARPLVPRALAQGTGIGIGIGQSALVHCHLVFG